MDNTCFYKLVSQTYYASLTESHLTSMCKPAVSTSDQCRRQDVAQDQVQLCTFIHYSVA